MESIGEFSKQVGLSMDTLRYYEKLGLIKPERSTTNRRLYDEKDVQWVAFIKRLKQIGMPIRQIIHYAELRATGESTISERMFLLEQQQQLLAEQAQQIKQHQAFLAQKLKAYQKMRSTVEINSN